MEIIDIDALEEVVYRGFIESYALPLELWENILLNCDASNLSRSSLVSKTWHVTSTSFLTSRRRIVTSDSFLQQRRHDLEGCAKALLLGSPSTSMFSLGSD